MTIQAVSRYFPSAINPYMANGPDMINGYGFDRNRPVVVNAAIPNQPPSVSVKPQTLEPGLKDRTPHTQNPAEQSPTQQQSSENTPPSPESALSEEQLTQAERALLTELKQVDAEVRRHEMAHVAAGAGLITSGASFTYQRGPDGRNYAVGGEVSIDTSPVPGDPQATLRKMEQVKRAALAPAEPSTQDLRVAARATSAATKAISEIAVNRVKEQAQAREEAAFGSLQQAADSYTRVHDLPLEREGSVLEIAV